MSSFNKKKRGGGGSGQGSSKKGSGASNANSADEVLPGMEGLEFEDPFADEFEAEEYDDAAIEKEAEEEAEEYDDDGDAENAGGNDEDEGGDDDELKKQVWRPGIDRLADGEVLEHDPSAYTMYHSMTTEWPCLSFDLLRDNMGEARSRFPHTMYMVCGSQADRAEKNKITILKMSDLHKTGGQIESDDENEDGDDDLVDEDPVLEHINCQHNGGINRIRAMPQQPGIVATWSDNGRVSIYDLVAPLKSLMEKRGPRVQAPAGPAFQFKGHRDEGYALDWSKVQEGRLASGDCTGAVHVWNMGSKTSDWNVSAKPLLGHSGSVEDIQWSPTEPTVFCTASTDRSIKIWDVRGDKAQISVNAHNDDVNVITWNSAVGYLLASGCDDGSFKVWDLRAVREGQPLANFTHHKEAITSLEWAPHDESVICVSSADNQVTVWDLSVEADDEEIAAAESAGLDFPPQLLFIHQGQSNVKEVHFHPQIPGAIVTTAEDGFNVFKPAISVA